VKALKRNGRYVVGGLFAVGLFSALVYVGFALSHRQLTVELDRADFIYKVLTVLALLAGGIWALFTFVLFRTAIANLQLAISPELIKYRGNLRVTLINVTLRNVGKVKITAGQAGCRLWVRRLPANLAHGQSLDLEAGESLIDGVDLLAKYDKEFPYEIEPGSEYHEFGNLVARTGDLLSITVTFYLGKLEDDAISEHRLVYIE
jgi:hypothetical protein